MMPKDRSDALVEAYRNAIYRALRDIRDNPPTPTPTSNATPNADMTPLDWRRDEET